MSGESGGLGIEELVKAIPLFSGLTGGSSTKVSQSTSTSSVAGLSLSIQNLIGGTGAPVSSSTPQSSSPVANATQTPDASPSPSYGSFPDTAYDTSLPAATTTGGTASGLMGSKGMLLAVLGLGGVALLAMSRRRK